MSRESARSFDATESASDVKVEAEVEAVAEDPATGVAEELEEVLALKFLAAT